MIGGGESLFRVVVPFHVQWHDSFNLCGLSRYRKNEVWSLHMRLDFEASLIFAQGLILDETLVLEQRPVFAEWAALEEWLILTKGWV